MGHLRSLEETRLNSDSLVTIGVFDGVHLGHKSLIRPLIDQARRTACNSIVVTFFPHPDKIITDATERYYLTTPEKRAELILQLGIDHVVTLAFDAEFRRLPAADFVERLVTNLNIRQLWVGQDFALGFQREGDVRYLRAQGAQRGFDVVAIDLISSQTDDMLISSSNLRELIRRGDMMKASAMLGRAYSMAGKVITGDKRGRTIGIPTANIEVWPEQIVPANGVYATWAVVGDQTHMAATNIGLRPTFSGEAVTIEAHLLDFDRDIYGDDLELFFIARLRPEQKFETLDHLLKQIHEDIRRSRQILAANPPA